MKMKSPILFSILSIILLCSILGLVSADSSSFDPSTSQYGTISITNGNGGIFAPVGHFLDGIGLGFMNPIPDDRVADYTLTSNDNQCLIDCEAQGTATLYNDGSLFDDINFKSVDDSLVQLQSYQFYILNTTFVDIPNYTTNCVPYTWIDSNGTTRDEQNCTQEQTGTHQQEDGSWIQYNLGDVLPAGDYTWKLDGKKNIDQSIDWVATKDDVELNNWAWWNQTIPKYVDFNSNTTSIPQSPYTIKLILNQTKGFNYGDTTAGGANLTFFEGDHNNPNLTTGSLPYFIAIWNTTGNSIIYVKVKSTILGNVTMYYNTSQNTASQSNIAQTFFFGDDFNSIDTNWTTNSMGVVTTPGILNVSHVSDSTTMHATSGWKVNTTSARVISSVSLESSPGVNGKAWGLTDGIGSPWGELDTRTMYNRMDPSDSAYYPNFLWTNDAGLKTNYSYMSGNYNPFTTRSFTPLEMIMTGNNLSTYIENVNPSIGIANYSSKNYNGSMKAVGFMITSGGGQMQVDWIGVSNYSTLEPSWTMKDVGNYSSPNSISINNSYPTNFSTITGGNPVTFLCNASTTGTTNITSVLLNASNSVKWNQVITGLNTQSYNASFTNSTMLNGNYTWDCIAYGNDGTNASSSFWNFSYYNVAPYFLTIPANQSVYYGSSINAVFLANSTWNNTITYNLGNWTNYFNINSTNGTLYNISAVPVGNYQINVTINDTNNVQNTTWWNVVVNKAVPVVTMSNGTNSISSNGLIGYYRFEGNGNDSSGYLNNGNATNMTYVTGVFGQAGMFNTNSFLILPNNSALTYSLVNETHLTISFWFNITNCTYNNPTFSGMNLINSYYNTTQQFALGCRNSTGKINGGFSNGTGGTAYFGTFASTNRIPTSSWHFLTLVYNGVISLSGSNTSLYIDNVLQTSSANFGSAGGSTPNIYIGSSGSFTGRLNGSLDEVQIWNRSLSSSEISMLYQTSTYYANQTSFSSSDNSGLTEQLYRNDVSNSNPETTILGAGSYYYISNQSGVNTNYSIVNFLLPLNINQASQNLNSYLNGGTSNITMTYPQQFNASYSGINGTSFIITDGNNNNLNLGQNYSYAVGNYQINYSAPANQNYTSYFNNINMTILQATSSLTLLLNGTATNLLMTYPSQINASYTNNTKINLTRNGVDVTSLNNAFQNLAVGYYNYTLKNIDTQNYTTSIIEYDANITQAIQSITPLLNGNNANLVITYPQQFNASYTGINLTTLTIKDNNSNSLIIGSNYTYAVGNYIINYSLPGNQNVSGFETYLNLTVNPGTSIVYAYINNSRSNYSNTITTVIPSIYVNGSQVSGEGKINMYLNGALINSGTGNIFNITTLPAVGNYNLSVIEPSSQNYTGSSETWWITVTANYPSVNLISPPDGNTSYTPNVNFVCNATTPISQIQNFSLWTNMSGTWAITQNSNYNATYDSYPSSVLNKSLWKNYSSGSYSSTGNSIGNYAYARVDIGAYQIRDENSQLNTTNIADYRTITYMKFNYSDISPTSPGLVTATTFLKVFGNILIINSGHTGWNNNNIIEIKKNGNNFDWYKDGTYQSTITPIENIIGVYAQEQTNNQQSTDLDTEADIYIINYNTSSLGSQSESFTFNQNINKNVLWSCSACTFDGNCNMANENRTENLNAIPPAITLTSPSGSYSFGINTLYLNWTLSGSPASSCWYTYNNINTSVPCGNAFTTFTPTATTTLIFYANDSIGNLGSAVANWNYGGAFINSQKWNNFTTEGNTENYIINVTYDNSTISNIIGYLIYNGVQYGSIKSGTGNNAVFTSTITVPSVTSTTNYSFYWDIQTINNSGNITNVFSSPLIQTVYNLQIGDCTSYSNLLLNYTLKDESTEIPLNGAIQNGTIEVNVQVYAIDKTTLIMNLSKKFNQTNNALICMQTAFTNNSNYTLNAQAKYYADGYVTRNNYIQFMPLTTSNIPQNIDLFDLLSTKATLFNIIYNDLSLYIRSGYVVNINKQYVSDNAFKTVDTFLTDDTGAGISNLDLTSVYNFVVTKNGQIVAAFNNTALVCQSPGSCTINLYPSFANLQQNDFRYTNNIGYAYNLNIPSRTLSVTYNTIDNSVANVNLSILENDAYLNTTLCTNSLNAASGTIICTIPPSYGNVSAVVFLNLNGYTINMGVFSTSSSAANLFNGSAFTLLLVLFLTLPMMFLPSNIMTLVGAIIGLIIGVMLFGVSSVLLAGSSFFIWIIAAVLAIIWKMNQRGDS